MTTKFAVLCLGALAVTGLGRAADAVPPPACCATVPAGGAVAGKTAPCCDALAPAAPLTARSLYQLDAPWTDDAGRTVSLAALRGQPVVLAMFFASCEYACPVLVGDMQRLRAALPAAVRAQTRFVLVSFDTARDTPAALAAYRAGATLDAGWTLLRGEAAAVQELAMLLGVKYQQDTRGQFSHSNLLTVLNPEGEIVHQHPGLQGDLSEVAQAVVGAAKRAAAAPPAK